MQREAQKYIMSVPAELACHTYTVFVWEALSKHCACADVNTEYSLRFTSGFWYNLSKFPRFQFQFPDGLMLSYIGFSAQLIINNLGVQ